MNSREGPPAGPMHALACLTRLADARSCSPHGEGRPLRGRRIVRARGVEADTLATPTGSAWIRMVAEGRASLCVVHDLDATGRAAVKRILDDDAAGALRGLARLAVDSREIGRGVWSPDVDGKDRRTRLRLVMEAALGACVVRDPALDIAQCIVSWAPGETLISFAHSGELKAPAASDDMTALVRSIGSVRSFVATRTWPVAGGIMRGLAPAWRPGAPDGVSVSDEEEMVVEGTDALSRMRIVSNGARAASTLGIDPMRLLAEP